MRYLFAIFIFFSNLSFAVTQSSVTINSLNINKGLGNFLFIRTSTPPVAGGCQTDTNWNFVLPLDSDLAKQIFTVLLAAQASHSKMVLTGTGTCSTWGIEYLNDVTIIAP